MTHSFQIEEEDRQMILLALAELALSRPGWNDTLTRLSSVFATGDGAVDNGRALFEGFKRTSADRVRATHASLGTSWPTEAPEEP